MNQDMLRIMLPHWGAFLRDQKGDILARNYMNRNEISLKVLIAAYALGIASGIPPTAHVIHSLRDETKPESVEPPQSMPCTGFFDEEEKPYSRV